MVHSAYDSFQLLKSCPSKIECAGSWNSKLLLGCIDGSLRIYAPESTLKQQQQQPSSSPDQTLEIKKEPYVLEKTVVGFSKKPLVSMEVLGSRKLLLSLSEWIAFHRLPDLEAFAMISKTKGANVYGWDDRRGFLCVAKQKKVILYRYDGGREFVEVKEFNVPDMVKAMSWCGENICLGIRREYMIMNGTTGALSEVFPCGRIAAPLVVPLPSGELLLGKDNIGVFVDQNGKLLQEGRICWSEPPGSVAIHMPYAVARLAKHIEIRSLRAPYPLVQTVTLRDIHFLVSSNNCLIAALDTCVYGLLPVPLGAQIVQLTASGDFEEALALCKLLPPEDSNLRAAKEGSIHIRYGHYLFDNRNYEEAMEQFLASSVDITHVLSLYPSIVLPKMAVSEPEKVLEFASDYTYLSRVSSDASDEMESSSPSNIEDQSDEKQMLEHKKMRHNALMALIKFLQRKRYVVIERATAERTEEVVFDAVQFDSHRPKGSSKNRGHMYISSGARETAAIMDTALLQALLLTGQHSSALELFKGPNYCDVKICEEFLRHRKFYVVLLELFKYNEMHHEALKLLDQLVEESNSNQTQSDLTQKFRPDMIVDYLKPLCATDPMLVLEFSMHVLESCPSQTIDLLLSGNISPDLVNSYLKQYAPHMQGTYLEHMLSMNEHGISNNLHNELVQIYLSEVLEWHGDLMAQQKWDEKEYTPTRKKLLSALENMSGYNPEVLLKRLPADALYEERALLLGKMQQHQLALSLYVHKLHGPELALAYCDRIYELGQNQPSSKAYTNIYLTLLQIYLNPQKTTKEFEQHIVNLVSTQGQGIQKSGLVKSKWGRGAKKIAEIEVAEDVRPILSSSDSGRSDGDGDEPSEGGPIMLDEALDLLSQRWDKINGAQALKLLPRETKFQNLLPFLEPLLKKSSEGLRNFSVIKSLRHSESLQVKEELYNHRRRVVKINSDSMCSLCNKRIGTSVFAVYPNGNTLVHFVCFRDSQNLKAVRGTPRVKRV